MVFSAKARTRESVAFVYDGDAGEPVLGNNEEGFVSWVPPEAVLTGSFGTYNHALFAAIRDTSPPEVTMGETKGFDESTEFEQDELIELEDEDGNVRLFALLAVVEVDGSNYAMLSPHKEMLESDEQLEVSLFGYEEDADGAVYSDIEDEAVFARVQTFCFALLRDEAELSEE